jgi:cell wall-associated NlpC family hydrolase
MKRIVLILLLCLGFSAPALAEEILSQTAAGVTLYSADEADPIESSGEATSGWRAKTQEVLMKAFSLTGIKYTYGGKTPETGFDCSGFVSYVFRNAINLTLPATARALSQIGKTVRKDELQPGDLVFFNTLKSAFSHVGIYVGDNKFIHSPRTGAAVRVESMRDGYWASRFNGGQRIDKVAEKSAPTTE